MTIGRIPSVEGGIQPTIVDAKGDLIAGVAADSVNRLAVGSNGTVLTADSSTSTGLAWTGVNQMANPFINGGFDIWQRGTSLSYAASTSAYSYNADRWQGGTSANQATTISRQSVSDSTNLPNIQYCMRWQRNSGQTGTAGYAPSHSIETANSIPFAGKTVTYSFYARKGADYSATGSALSVYMVTGTGTDQSLQAGFTNQATVLNQTATLTTSWQRFAYTVTLASNITQIGAYWIFTPTGTAGTNDYFEVTGVQLDIGTYTATTAPTFRRSGGTLQGELAACQRYYQRIEANATNNLAALGGTFAFSTTQAITYLPLKVNMRVVPTLNQSAVGDFYVSDIVANNYTPTSLGISTVRSTPYQLVILPVVASGLTQFRWYSLQANTSTAWFEMSSEL